MNRKLLLGMIIFLTIVIIFLIVLVVLAKQSLSESSLKDDLSQKEDVISDSLLIDLEQLSTEFEYDLSGSKIIDLE